VGDLTMRVPEVRAVGRGGFEGWMRARGKYGGQNKVPRMDNSGETTRDLVRLSKAERRCSGEERNSSSSHRQNALCVVAGNPARQSEMGRKIRKNRCPPGCVLLDIPMVLFSTDSLPS